MGSELSKGAVISDCGKYRYRLWRVWDETLPLVCFVMLNPSTADATKDDPTIRKCIAFGKKWGAGGIYVANIFAYRSTDPKALYKLTRDEAIGPENLNWLVHSNLACEVTVAAWGNHGKLYGRGQEVRDLLCNLTYLRLSKSGHPWHPLYLPGDLKPTYFKTP